MIKFLEALVVSIVAIFAPIQSLLITTAVMIAADLITGIIAARKRGEAITSSGLRRTISKLFVYEFAILMAYLAEHYMSNALPFVKMASSMVSLVELKSIYENLSTIGDQDLLKSLISQLGSESKKS